MMSVATTRTAMAVQLEITLKDGSQPTPAQLVQWISSCLNCNTNHAEVKVSAVDNEQDQSTRRRGDTPRP